MKITMWISSSIGRGLDVPRLVFDLPERGDVLAALHRLIQRYPQIESRLFTTRGEVHRHINVLINGRNVSLKQGFKTILKDSDHLTILPPTGGG